MSQHIYLKSVETVISSFDNPIKHGYMILTDGGRVLPTSVYLKTREIKGERMENEIKELEEKLTKFKDDIAEIVEEKQIIEDPKWGRTYFTSVYETTIGKTF